MDFIRPEDHKYVSYCIILKNSIIFFKLLKANYNEQTVEIISFPIEEKILVKEVTCVFPITTNIFETLRSLATS